MPDPVVGKVAAIESNFSIVINRGSSHRVKKGMVFAIEDPKGKEVADPDDSNEIIGYLPVEKIRVRVFDVQEKLCRAETFIRVKPESAYEAVARELLNDYRRSSIFDLGRIVNPPYTGDSNAKLQQALDMLRIGAATRSADERPAVVEVNIGDVARQVQ